MPGSLDAYHDSDRILRQAASTFFDHLSEMCEGILLVDRNARVVWINDRYERYLQRLGFERPEDMIGRAVEDVVPNTRMKQVVDTGRPILLDVLENKSGTFLVSRIPLHDDRGVVIGAVGLILYDELEPLKPLFDRIRGLQQELEAAQRELAQQRRTRYTFSNFVGNSAPAIAVKSRARRAAVLSTTVLLQGETGTGKELLAQAIHAASARASRPFIAVNVAAIPDTLLEAEFFGVAPGAFTGADRRGRDGKFKLADGGTLFLDEIGDMPLALQGKLLRVLQERELEPLGSNHVLRVDVRVIAASSVDLAQRVEEGRFRADLYYRLNVLPIRLPPLRERLEDLEPLCEHLLEQIALEQGTVPKDIDAAALAELAAREWRGNIRELRNALEQACSFCDGMRLTADAFAPAGPSPVPSRPLSQALSLPPPPALRDRQDPGIGTGVARATGLGWDGGSLLARAAGPGHDASPADDPPLSLPEMISRLERESIRAALQATGGNRVQAARRLGISRATLYQKLALHPDLSDNQTHE